MRVGMFSWFFLAFVANFGFLSSTSAWLASSPTGYTVSNSLLVQGSVSIVNSSSQVVDLYSMIQQLQVQVSQLIAQLALEPTMQVFTGGYGTYTPSSKLAYIRVRMVGGGGGGAGSGAYGYSPNPGFGSNGSPTTFGSNFTCSGGHGGHVFGADGTIGPPPISGTNTVLGTGFLVISSIQGSYGQGGAGANIAGTAFAGGQGGSSFFGGSGAGGGVFESGQQGLPNTGAGGGGGGGALENEDNSGGGGGAGGYLEIIIPHPSGSIPYVVGVGGNGGSAGNTGSTGGTGADGIIIVEEFYH